MDEINGSQLFNWRNAELTAGSEENFDMRNHSVYGKFLPIDTILISNNSDETIEVIFNGNSNKRRIFSKTTRAYENQSITSIKVKNDGTTTIDAEDVEIEFQKSGYDADKAARASRKPLNRLLGLFTGRLF